MTSCESKSTSYGRSATGSGRSAITSARPRHISPRSSASNEGSAFAMGATTSWRVTAPLRAVRRRIRFEEHN